MRTSLIRLTIITSTLFLFSASVSATATWPDRPIRLIVPFAPGGTADTLGRLVADKLSQKLGQSVIVENKPGAGSMIGSQVVAQAKPDGYTLLLGSISNVINNYFYKDPLYNLETDLTPIIELTDVPNYLVVNKSSPINSVGELIAEAKAQPDKLSCGTSGVGTSPYLSCELLKSMAGISMINAPYKGAGPALQDTIGGRTTVTFANGGLSYIQNGTVKGLAVTSAQRMPLAPDLPAISETLPGFNVSAWFGLWAPSGTAPQIIQRISEEVGAILKTPDVQHGLATLGGVSVDSSPETFKVLIAAEMKKWQEIIGKLNLTAK